MENKIISPIIKGIVITLILIVFGLVIYFAGEMTNKGLSYIQYVILIIGIILSCTSFAKQMNANVTFGNVFAHGFKTSMVCAVLLSIYTVLALKVLFPDMLDTIINTARQQMQQQGKLSEEQMQSALDMTKKFIVPFAIGGILIMFAIMGAIASLIGAAVAKKQPQNPFS
ncbi:MAG: DUF4199 domain-containing protein [Bacteroidetes bacterium]|nr:DUF4199 domain-containing protein [Bacteroidota bacterium]